MRAHQRLTSLKRRLLGDRKDRRPYSLPVGFATGTWTAAVAIGGPLAITAASSVASAQPLLTQSERILVRLSFARWTAPLATSASPCPLSAATSFGSSNSASR